ncbi:MAG TPA: S8 family serine peptidase [Fimbriimonadales bacterium]|nr:S8 family serine peptidase [Fimbriimonadales bacterium]
MTGKLWKWISCLIISASSFGVTAFALDTDYPYKKGEIIVWLKNQSTTYDQASSFAQSYGMVLKRMMRAPGMFLIYLPDADKLSELEEKAIIQEKLDAIRESVLVKAAYLNHKVELYQNPNDPELGTSVNDTTKQWNLFQIGLPDPGGAWETTKGRDGVIVADIDTWYDLDHPDFLDKFGNLRFITGYNTFTGGTEVRPPLPPDALDFFTHGTMTASVMVAGTDNALDMAGVTWEGVKCLPIVACDDFGNLWFELIFDAYQFVIDYNEIPDLPPLLAQNMSYGAGFPDAISEQMLNHIASQGTIPFASSGNSRPFPAGWPASFKSVVSVAGTRYDGGTKGTFASYSSPGSEDGIHKVDIATPTGDFTADVLCLGYFGGSSGTVAGGGTSYSCPEAVGAAALLFSGGIAREDIVDVLKETAVVAPGDTKPNLDTGWGEIDVAAAAALLVPYIKPITPENGATIKYQKVPFVFRLFRVETSGANAPVVTIETQDGSFSQTVDAGDYTIDPDPEGDPNIFILKGATRLYDGVNNDNSWIIRVEGVDDATNAIPVEGEVQLSVVSHKWTTFSEPSTGKIMFSLPYGIGGDGAPPGGYLPEDLFGTLGVDFDMARWVFTGLDANGNPQGTYSFYTGGDNTQDAGFTPASAEIIKTYQSGSTTQETPQNGPWGVGWWLLLPTNFTASMPVEEGPEPDVLHYRIKLNPGWNQFGNPYDYFVDWGNCLIVIETTFGENVYTIDEAAAKKIINPQIFRWQLTSDGTGVDMDYTWRGTANGQLVPFESHWVRAHKECWLQVPPTPANESSPKGDGSIIHGDGWAMQLSVEAPGARDKNNFFGATKDFDESQDVVAEPPPGPNDVVLYFLGKDGKTAVAQDLREFSKSKQTYTFVVRPHRANATYTLRWNEIASSSQRIRLTLYDEATEKTQIVRNGTTFQFRADEKLTPRKFTITAVPETPGKLLISGTRVSGGARSSYTIQYTLTTDANVQVRILATNGKYIADLESRSRSAGTATVVWNGRDSRGIAVPPGVYIVQILAETPEGERARVTTPVTVVR